MSGVQFANLILPFVYLPYVARVLGIENFGIADYALSFSVYFNSLVSYGFDYSASKAISQASNNEDRNNIFNKVINTKLFLFIVFGAIYFFLVQVVPSFKAESKVFHLAFIGCTASLLSPWFFLQGVERIKLIAKINFVVKLLATGIVFLLIKKPEDYPMLVIVNTLPQLVLSIFIMYWIVATYKFKLKRASLKSIIRALKKNFYIFGNEFSTLVLVNSILLVMGFVVSKKELGAYTSAYRIISSMQLLLVAPFVKSGLPFFSKLYSNSRQMFYRDLKKVGSIYCITVFLCCTLVFVFSKEIVFILFGKSYFQAYYILRIMCYTPFFLSISAVYGWIGIHILGAENRLFLTTTSIGTLGILGAILFRNHLNVSHFAFIRISTELCISLMVSLIFFNLAKRRKKQ
ncbi:hypothetical protein VC82_1359 [Flagellimonas lutaonensis]|uniref:Polysaccharide biosynthesis protein n=1 Tax=Flagellimonas lutaonensis TaxID=516051 RepID=A0A0D5YRS9_9FLAO|nr:hypothetical protein VC82_1359 [Allomuricauda lutaonensis]